MITIPLTIIVRLSWAAAMLLPWNKFLELNDSVAEDSEAVDDVGLKEAIGKLNSSF